MRFLAFLRAWWEGHERPAAVPSDLCSAEMKRAEIAARVAMLEREREVAQAQRRQGGRGAARQDS